MLTGLTALEGGEIIHDSPVMADAPPAGAGAPERPAEGEAGEGAAVVR